MLSNIKNYLLGLWALATAGFALMFIYERNKATVAEAQVGEADTKASLAISNAHIESNDKQLADEEAKRAQLEKEEHYDASPDDIVEYFNKRK